MSVLCGRRHDLDNYPFEKVPLQMREDLLRAAERHLPYFSENMVLALIGLEFFCQVYHCKVSVDIKQAELNRQIFESYCALVSEGHIFKRNARGNALVARYFLKVTQTLDYVAKSHLEVSTVFGVDSSSQIVKTATSLPVNQNLLKFWKGWPSTSASGRTTYLPLQDVYRYCGEAFTQQLFSAMDNYNSVRHRGLHGTWSEMLSVFVSLGKRNQLNQLKNPRYARTFFSTVLRQFLATAKTNGHSIKYASLAIEWRNHFHTFALEYLCESGLLAFPSGGFPMPRGERTAGRHTNVRINRDGVAVKEKLLTDVPLEVSDQSAINILFNDIQRDIEVIRSWAEKVTSDIWRAVCLRKQRAIKGVLVPLYIKDDEEFLQADSTKEWLRSPKNPDCLENMAATFEHYGYLTGNDGPLETIYADRYQAARELGIPTIKVLIAYCSLLVIHHPELTKSALQSLKLFDKHGELVGLRLSDSGSYLVSYKKRSRAKNAEKITLLNDQSQKLIEELIEVTAPLRKYLRQIGDDNWR